MLNVYHAKQYALQASPVRLRACKQTTHNKIKLIVEDMYFALIN